MAQGQAPTEGFAGACLQPAAYARHGALPCVDGATRVTGTSFRARQSSLEITSAGALSLRCRVSLDLGRLAADDLAELLAATAAPSIPTRRRRQLGGREAPGNDGWVAIPTGGEIRFTRSKPFTVWEGKLFEPYGTALADLDGVPDAVARAAAPDVLPRAIASQIGGVYGPVLEQAIRFMLLAASSNYEGQAISTSLAIDFDLVAPQWAFLDLDAFADHDWHAVLASGSATAIVLDRFGHVLELVDMHALNAGRPTPRDALYPDAFRYLGHWAQLGNRVAVSLTRGREILVHQGGFLRYIYRSGRWKALPVDNATGIAWGHGSRIAPNVKTAVLASAIDASLAHHGACIAVIAKGRLVDFNRAGIVSSADRWPGSPSSRLFRTVSFLGLTRRQRVELLSMDGATVLSRTGDVLAAGAIVQVPGGSAGGGRLAATLALAAYGAALKVSQDGPVRLFAQTSAGPPSELMTLA